jgi:hypothetical protein
MTSERKLRLLPAPEDRGTEIPVSSKPSTEISVVGDSTARRLAPGAPKSPGTMPFEYAKELRVGEAAVWWNHKETISWAPILWVTGAAVLLVAIATALVPEFWSQPLDELWKGVVPALLPSLLLLGREWFSRRAIVVTDNSVIGFDHRGRVERLGFRNVRAIKRDLLTGGVVLEGAEHKIRIPPMLADDARDAVASQVRHTLRGSQEIDDSLGWFPR